MLVQVHTSIDNMRLVQVQLDSFDDPTLGSDATFVLQVIQKARAKAREFENALNKLRWFRYVNKIISVTRNPTPLILLKPHAL